MRPQRPRWGLPSGGHLEKQPIWTRFLRQAWSGDRAVRLAAPPSRAGSRLPASYLKVGDEATCEFCRARPPDVVHGSTATIPPGRGARGRTWGSTTRRGGRREVGGAPGENQVVKARVVLAAWAKRHPMSSRDVDRSSPHAPTWPTPRGRPISPIASGCRRRAGGGLFLAGGVAMTAGPARAEDRVCREHRSRPALAPSEASRRDTQCGAPAAWGDH